jgi:hypothetical protein
MPESESQKLRDELDRIDLRHAGRDTHTQHAVRSQNGARLVWSHQRLGHVKNPRSRFMAATKLWKMKHEHTKELELGYYRPPNEKRLP